MGEAGGERGVRGLKAREASCPCPPSTLLPLLARPLGVGDR